MNVKWLLVRRSKGADGPWRVWDVPKLLVLRHADPQGTPQGTYPWSAVAGSGSRQPNSGGRLRGQACLLAACSDGHIRAAEALCSIDESHTTRVRAVLQPSWAAGQGCALFYQHAACTRRSAGPQHRGFCLVGTALAPQVDHLRPPAETRCWGRPVVASDHAVPASVDNFAKVVDNRTPGMG
jgi:hypothetical protein